MLNTDLQSLNFIYSITNVCKQVQVSTNTCKRLIPYRDVHREP